MSSPDCCRCWQLIRFSYPLSFLRHSQFVRAVRRLPFLLLALVPLLLAAAPSVHASYITTQYTLASCNTTQCANGISGVTNISAVNFFPERTTADELQAWDVFYTNAYKVLEIPATGEQYVLYECGTSVPAVGNVTMQYVHYSNAGQELVGSHTVEIRPDAKFFKVPLQKMCIQGTTPVSFLEMLGVRSAIHRADVAYIASPCIEALYNSGIIGQLDYNNAAEEAECDSIINADNGASSDPKAITFPATADLSLMDRAEYLEYLAVFFNREAIANSLISAIRSRFIAYSIMAASQPISPLAAWIVYNSYNPAGQNYYIDTTTYKLELLVKAGAIPYIPENSYFPTPQALMAALRKQGVSWVLDATFHFGGAFYSYSDFGSTWNLSASDLNPSTSSYVFIQQQHVWRNDRNVAQNDADDWFESAVVNVDALLYDFVTAVFPSIAPKYQRIWLRNLALGETPLTTFASCTGPHATVPLMTNLSTLTASAFPGCPSWYLNPTLYGSNTGGNGYVNSARAAAMPLFLLITAISACVSYISSHM